MSDTSDSSKILAESLSAETVNAAAVAAEAHQKAQAAQIEVAMQSAMESYFSRGVQEKRFVDVGRIPFICDDLRGIHDILSDMANDSKWVKLIAQVTGLVFTLVILPLIVWMLLQIMESSTAIAVLTHAAR